MGGEEPDELMLDDDVEPDPKAAGPNVCVECGGTGQVGGEICPTCRGSAHADEAVKG